MSGDQRGWQFDGDLSALEDTADVWHVRVIQPYQALKTYRCPGCDQEIFPKTLHVVVWSDDEPDLRRHWHRPCWQRHQSLDEAT